METDQRAPNEKALTNRVYGLETPDWEGVVGVRVNGDRQDKIPPAYGVSAINEDFVDLATHKRIVMVGINLSTEAWLTKNLGDRGFSFHRIPDSRGGNNFTGGETINGVLWDLEASSLKGFAVVSQLQRKNSEVPVMVLANPSNKKKVIESIEKGVMDCLIKPIDLEELRNKCVRLFG